MKNVIITGGSRGIGRASAELFARKGWRVAICYNRSGEDARRLSEELNNSGCLTGIYRLDVSDSRETARTAAKIEEDFGQIDCLVNNAGISSQKLFTDISDEDWNEMISVNLSGAFYLTRAVLPGMIRRKSGAIVNISSVWGICGASCEVHYSAAKAGLIGLTRALAKETAPSGIRVNCVAPGAVRTRMLDGFSGQELDDFAGELPLGRIGEPGEIAEVIYFLADEKSSYITGEVISASGGMI